MKGISRILHCALVVPSILGAISPSTAQPAAGEVVYGPSEAERLQLQEMTRSNQANIKSLQDDTQVIKLNANGVGSVMTAGTMIIPSAGQLGASFANFIWSDNQGIWKIDKFGKQCAVASSSSTDPCLY